MLKSMPNLKEVLNNLCDIGVTSCLAHVSEFSPGTEYFDADDSEVLIKHLQQTPDLTGVLLDGLASVRRPATLNDDVVFYNKTEEEVLKHLEDVPAHEHVHWMFKELLGIQDLWLGKFRAALPKAKIVYSIDSDDFAATAERLLRVIVQSAAVKTSQAKQSLEDRVKDLEAQLNGPGKLTSIALQAKLRELEAVRRKLVEDPNKPDLKPVEADIAEVEADIALIAQRDRLLIQQKAYKEQKDEKRLAVTEADLVLVHAKITSKENGLIKELNSLEGQRAVVYGKSGKQDERDALDAKIKKCKKKIAEIKERFAEIAVNIKKLDKKFKNLREPETSPVYQRRVSEHVRKLYKRFYTLGTKHDISIVTKPDILVFGDMVVDYAHDRGRTWQPMPGRVKKLAEAYHGRMKNYSDNIAATLEQMGVSAREIDLVLESGHHGVFFVRWQRQRLTDEEIRMQHVNTFQTNGNDGVKHTMFAAGMPFEAQDKIAKHVNRGKPGRTRAGKPMASASHPVYVRYEKGGVSGTQLFRKHKNGHMSVEAIVYKLFRNKEVLKPFTAVMSQDDSDNHLNSPEMDAIGTLGTMVLIDHLMDNPLELYNTKVYIGSTFNIGDTAEANSTAWKEATKFRRSVMEEVAELPTKIVATNVDDYESVMKTVLEWATDMMGGSNENMKLTLRVVRWFLKQKFLKVYHNSPTRLRDILATLEGNHAANAMSKFNGVQEFSFFEEWLFAVRDMIKDFPEAGYKPFPVKIEAGGEHHQPTSDDTEMVAHLGGYSVSRQGIIPEYGIGHNGKLMTQKTYRVGLTHEPNAILNKARNQEADVIKGGHTHEEHLTADKSGDNDARFIDQKGCTQRVSGTETLYGGLPRTATISLCVYSQPGRYFKLAIPMQHMRAIGLAWLKLKAKEAVDGKKNLGQTKTGVAKKR